MPINDFPCPHCGARCFPGENTCPSCAVDIDRAAAEVERFVPARKYPALRIIATVYQIIAGVIAVVTLISLTLGQPPIVIILSLVLGLTAVVSFFALSEGIKLFIDLEHNSRVIVALLEAREAKRDNH
jgi:hypothetical protein